LKHILENENDTFLDTFLEFLKKWKFWHLKRKYFLLFLKSIFFLNGKPLFLFERNESIFIFLKNKIFLKNFCFEMIYFSKHILESEKNTFLDLKTWFWIFFLEIDLLSFFYFDFEILGLDRIRICRDPSLSDPWLRGSRSVSRNGSDPIPWQA
jgi:hypothetical protein